MLAPDGGDGGRDGGAGGGGESVSGESVIGSAEVISTASRCCPHSWASCNTWSIIQAACSRLISFNEGHREVTQERYGAQRGALKGDRRFTANDPSTIRSARRV